MILNVDNPTCHTKLKKASTNIDPTLQSQSNPTLQKFQHTPSTICDSRIERELQVRRQFPNNKSQKIHEHREIQGLKENCQLGGNSRVTRI
jgi:hypothetical protein